MSIQPAPPVPSQGFAHIRAAVRLPALLCALAFALCALATHPCAEIGMNDDWSYIRTAQLLAQTGHIAYNGFATAMLGWQLLPAPLIIKLFGFSFTVVRFSIFPIAIATTFLLQRTFVRAGLEEWNAALATLTLVLSPLFLPLALSFMTDVPGLFAIVVCLYACLRTVQASTPRTAIAWICFALLSNAVGGTARQIAWLGTLVMVPSTLWLVRRRPRVALFAMPLLLASIAFLFAAMHWFEHQPYAVPEHLLPGPIGYPELRQLIHYLEAAILELPLFLLPVLLPFLPALRRADSKSLKAAAACTLALLLVAIDLAHKHLLQGLEPVLPGFVSAHGLAITEIHGEPPTILNTPLRFTLTALVCAAVFSFVATLFATGPGHPDQQQPSDQRITWPDLGVLLGPFSLVYLALLMPRAAFDALYDRYLLALGMAALILIVRCYQDQVQARLPPAGLVLIVLIAIYAVAGTHDAFATYRARLAAINQLRSAGVPDTAIDGGFEFDAWTETQLAPAISDPVARWPAGAPHLAPPNIPSAVCHAPWQINLPHIAPRYGISFDPNLCFGPAPFPPIVYRTWLPPHEVALYTVWYIKPFDR